MDIGNMACTVSTPPLNRLWFKQSHMYVCWMDHLFCHVWGETMGGKWQMNHIERVILNICIKDPNPFCVALNICSKTIIHYQHKSNHSTNFRRAFTFYGNHTIKIIAYFCYFGDLVIHIKIIVNYLSYNLLQTLFLEIFRSCI